MSEPDPCFRRILVTGGCGFIGANLVRHLLREHPRLEVVNLDALTYAGNLDNLAGITEDSRYHFVHGRVEDPASSREALDGVDAVVHLAAESHVDRSILSPQVFITTNVVGTQVLLDAALSLKVRRFLHVSTDEVYGPTPAEARFDERAAFRPTSPYAASKAAADLLALAYARTYGLDVVVTRCSNNFGPYQLPEKLIPLTIVNALEDRPIPVYGDGRQTRDWIHVEDHCRALVTVLTGGAPGSAYNVASGRSLPNLDLVRCVVDALGKPGSLVRHVEDRPAHDRCYALDAERLTRELGWRPRYSLEQGLRETIQWYRDHRSWWERVRDGSYREYYDIQYGERLGDEK